MKTEKIIWGLILIFIGTIFMLDNFNVIEFYWSAVWRLWPIIFILIGANMIFSRLENKSLAPLFAAGITVLALGLVTYEGTRPGGGRHGIHVRIEHDDDEGANDPNLSWSSADAFSEPYSGAANANLKIMGGATEFRLADTSAQLFDARVSDTDGRYNLTRTTNGDTDMITFRKRDRDRRGTRVDNLGDSEAVLRLNRNPLWNISVEMGAGETSLDLRKFKVRKLSFEGGAAAFSAKIGSLSPQTDVTVETGVASVEISVPESSGARIVVDSGLSSKDFQDFDKQADGSYQTPNYETAANKVNISLKGGLSSFEVKRE